MSKVDKTIPMESSLRKLSEVPHNKRGESFVKKLKNLTKLLKWKNKKSDI